MNRLVLIVWLILPLRLAAAPGEIIGAQVETNGWVLQLTFNGMTNQGTFRSGLAEPYRTLTSTTAVALLVYDLGFNSSGASVSNARTIYATRQLRSPYPNVNSNEFIMQSTNCVGRFALSDWVYSNSILAALEIRTNAYNANSISSWALSAASWTTNSSTNEYPKPIANWTKPPFRKGTSADVAVVAFDHHSSDGTPVACVKFYTKDSSGASTATQIVSRPTLRKTEFGANEILYESSYSLSGLAIGLVTNHFKVFPKYGTNYLLTEDGQFAFPSPNHAPSPHFYTNELHGVTLAWVDPVNGSSSGVATTNRQIAFTNMFATLAAAATAIGRTNWLLFGRSDAGGGIIFLTNSAVYIHSGATTTITNQPDTYLTVMPMSGVTRDQVVITNASDSKHLGGKLMFSNVTFRSASASATFNSTFYLWLDRCLLTNNTGSTFFGTVSNLYLTRNQINGINAGLISIGSDNMNPRIIEGNDFSWFGGTVHHGTWVGNTRFAGTNDAIKWSWANSTTRNPPSYPIICYNVIKCQNQGTSQMIEIAPPNSYMQFTNGAAIVQNVFECVNGAGSQGRLLSISVSGSNGDTNPVTRMVIYNNTMVGQRGPHGFDNSSSAGGFGSAQRQLNTVANNASDNINMKSDNSSTQSGAHLGSLPVAYGVNWTGNQDLDPGNPAFDSAWNFDFLGIGSVMNTNFGTFGPTATWATWTKYANRNSATGDTNIVSGNGDYRLLSTSPLFSVPTRWILPWDIEGMPRGRFDPPGAHSQGNLKKGAFF